jgi:hypothetical protein
MKRSKPISASLLNLDTWLKTNKIKKYKFCERIGISRYSLHKYITGRLQMPLKVKKAIMQETNNVIHFEEVN